FTDPEVGSSSRITDLPVVDFPQPDSPTSPRVSPALTSNEISETAWTVPTWRLNTPPVMGNSLTRLRTSRIVSPGCARPDSPPSILASGADGAFMWILLQ